MYVYYKRSNSETAKWKGHIGQGMGGEAQSFMPSLDMLSFQHVYLFNLEVLQNSSFRDFYEGVYMEVPLVDTLMQ